MNLRVVLVALPFLLSLSGCTMFDDCSEQTHTTCPGQTDPAPTPTAAATPTPNAAVRFVVTGLNAPAGDGLIARLRWQGEYASCDAVQLSGDGSITIFAHDVVAAGESYSARVTVNEDSPFGGQQLTLPLTATLGTNEIDFDFSSVPQADPSDFLSDACP